jgi:hypothetical protein
MDATPHDAIRERAAEIRRDPEALIAFLRHELCPRYSSAEWPDAEAMVRGALLIAETGVSTIEGVLARLEPVPIRGPEILAAMRIVAQHAADEMDDLARRAAHAETDLGRRQERLLRLSRSARSTRRYLARFARCNGG